MVLAPTTIWSCCYCLTLSKAGGAFDDVRGESESNHESEVFTFSFFCWLSICFAGRSSSSEAPFSTVSVEPSQTSSASSAIPASIPSSPSTVSPILSPTCETSAASSLYHRQFRQLYCPVLCHRDVHLRLGHRPTSYPQRLNHR